MIEKVTIMIIIIGWISTIKNIFRINENNIWKKIIIILISLELILIAIAIIFLYLSIYIDDINGAINTLFILTIGAAETSIGLSIIIKLNKELSLTPLSI